MKDHVVSGYGTSGVQNYIRPLPSDDRARCFGKSKPLAMIPRIRGKEDDG
jgi:hypothetical protein